MTRGLPIRASIWIGEIDLDELHVEHPGAARVAVDCSNQRTQRILGLSNASFQPCPSHTPLVGAGGKSRRLVNHRTIGNRVYDALRVPSLADRPFASIERRGSLQNRGDQARARELDEHQGQELPGIAPEPRVNPRYGRMEPTILTPVVA